MTTKAIKGAKSSLIHINPNSILTTIFGGIISIGVAIAIYLLQHGMQNVSDMKTDVTVIKTELPHIQSDVFSLKTTSVTHEELKAGHVELSAKLSALQTEQNRVATALALAKPK